MENFKVHTIKKIPTPSFIMSPMELHEHIDFEVKRVYFISKPTQATGSHCHLREKEFFFMTSGSCVAVIDRGKGLEEVEMNAPESGLYIANHVWHHFKDFSDDAVLVALSSTNYNPNREDYIEDYDLFLQKIYPLLNQ